MQRNGKDDHLAAHDDCDLLPYASMPYAHTQPARLAAVAALHGLETPSVESAHVLELGCAAAGNLIPLAARFPNARFLGIDLGRRHIEEARQRISDLGLSNIEVRQANIGELRLEQKFGYIICHGVFSWTPRSVQDAIFRVGAESLADNGVALISFNVLPGWHLRGAIRDLCLRNADASLAPMQRVAKLRAFLNDIAASANVAEPYGLLMRNEAKRLARRPASYMMGEFLAADNAPCYVTDFAARASQQGLEYLSEADLEASVPQVLSEQLRVRLEAYAGSDALAREQHVDYFTGRTFRNAILVKSGESRGVRDDSALRRLHLSARLQPAPNQSGEALAEFKDPRNRTIRTKDAEVARALTLLAEAYPSTRGFHEIAGADASEAAAERLWRALSRLVHVGQVEISSIPVHVSGSGQSRPQVWALARMEVAAGQPWMTSQRHEAVIVRPITALLVPRLDGTVEREHMKALLVNAFRRGELEAPQSESAPIEEVAERSLDRLLSFLATNALLI